jgi:putative endonuclease
LRSSSIRIGRASYHPAERRVKSGADRTRRRYHGRVPAAAPRPWSVYLLRCCDGTLYAGATNDVERRLRAHARGAVKYTRGRLPVALAWIEEVGGRGAALSREAALKRLPRAKKEALLRSSGDVRPSSSPRGKGGGGTLRARPSKRVAGGGGRGRAASRPPI